MANNKNISYDVKVAYGSTINETNKVRSSIEQLLDAVNRLKRNTNINVKFTGIPKSMDKAVATVASLSNAMERLEKTSGKTYGTLDGVSQRLKQIKVDSVDMAKGLKESAKAISDIEKNTKKSNKYYKQQSTSEQISNLKNQADVLYQAWKAGTVQSSEYTNKMNAIRSRLSGLYESQRTVNNLTKEQIGLLKQWGFELNAVGSRMGYLATRFAALWAGDQVMKSLSALPKVEQDMAGFAQVMKHGTGETNAFSKSLLEVDPNKMTNALQLTGNEASHFKHELSDMQEKLQGLATKYGTTSHEMIESAKLWGRAYKDNNTVLALTDAATKLAVADAFDIVSANKALESSIMQWGFQIGNANEAMTVSSRIIDSWTALAHNYTVSAQTLSEANKRMAQSAAEVGVGFHTAQALISVMARKTQAEGGEIGNALKSIFGSIHSNKAITELQKFGIEVYNFGENGEKSFRKVDDVLLDLMIKADGSKESLEGLLKAISGGKWQWNKADAMLDLQEYLTALRISSSSFGFTDAQVGMQLDTIQTKMQQIAAEWERIMTSNGNIANGFKTVLDLVLNLLQWIDRLPSGVFLYTTAMMGLMFVYKKFQASQEQIRASISRAWQSATTAVNNYTAAVKASYAQTGGMRGTFSATKTAVTGLGRAVQSATAFMGGWVGIVLTAISVVSDWYMASLDTTKAIREEADTHTQLLQRYQETYQRLSEAKNIASQYITVIDSLKSKISEINKVNGDASHSQEELETATQGLIDILGEEKTQWVLQGETVEEQNRRMEAAIQEKQKELEVNIEKEKKSLREARKAIAEVADADKQALESEKTSWFTRFELILKYIGLLDAAKDAWNNFKLNTAKEQAEEAETDYAHAAVKLSNEQDKLAMLKANGASDFEIRKQELAVKTAQVTNDAARKLMYDSQSLVAKEQAEVDKTTNLAKAKAVLQANNDIGSLGLTNNHGGSPDDPSYNTTGEYHRNELSDDADDDAKGKKGSSNAKEKNPLYGTKEGTAIDFLMKQGLTANQAYGIVGNLIQESELNPLAVNPTGHRGIAQWDEYRWGNLESFASANNSDPDAFETQLAFIIHELNTTERENWQNVLAKSVNQTPEEYAHYFDMFVERSGGEESAQRQAYARELANTGYGQDVDRVDDRANKILEKQKKLDEIMQKLTDKQIELTNAMKPKEQAELEKSTNDLNKKINEITNDMTELKKLNPKADVTAFKETLQKYTEVMKHRIQDEDTMRRFDKAETHMKDTQAMQKLELDGIAENFWTSDIREVQFVNEQLDIAKKKLEYIQEAISRGDSNFSDEDLRKATLAVKQLENESKKLAKTLKEDVRKQTHDVFHSLIFEGQSIKDVWKNLWKQLAEDALKMMFKINDGKGGLLQNLLKMKDKKYLAGINGINGKDGANGKIGGIDESLNQQMLTAQSTRNLDQNFALFMQNTQGGTAWNQATFTDAVIYGTTEGNSKDIELPEGNKDTDKQEDISKYINAGMKLGSANTGWGKALGIAGTLAGFAQKFGLLHFAGGGYVNKDQLVRVGEGNKKEWIIPTSNKSRGRQLLGQAAKDLDIGFTSGIEPKWQHEDTAKGALYEQTKRQDKLMSRMVANSEAMTKGMNYMANNGANTSESIAQPVFVKQTISDQDFLAKYQKLVALGKMRRA